ncbi:MAG: aspartate aminotransferase family protein [Pirellulaceae bacterium]
MSIAASPLVAEYCRRTPTSARLAERARNLFPGGVTHDARLFQPHPLYVDHAVGSRKWDVDGNEYVDYFGGHGALLLGHNDPHVADAVSMQLTLGTHYGACHELEIEWAELVQRLLPSAERVRFTSSGTEATLLALRLARAFTGRAKIVRFLTNFHGWHDHVAFGVGSHFDGAASAGVLPEVAENVLLCEPGDLDAVQSLLSERDDVAAVILEPTGATWGKIPIAESYLHGLRAITAEHEVLLIFDEVVSGFRCSPGGAQGCLGITPDLTTLAKILAGGLPGGAVVGRREVMDLLDPQAAAEAGREKIAHHGTFNANPLSAAAGVAALTLIAETDACQRANRYAARLRDGMRQVVASAGLKWIVYGTYSGFHIFTNPEGDEVTAEQIEAGGYDWRKLKAAQSSPVTRDIRLAMLIHGVDMLSWPGGPTSAVHTDDDLAWTLDAFGQAVRMIQEA